MNNSYRQRSPFPFQKNRLKKSLSQRKHIKIETQQNKGEGLNKEISFKIQFQVPEVNLLVNQFQKQISSPIAYHIDVSNSRNAPKCMTHNNVLSLYCLNDSKPLCVSCMYQTSHHKPHKVIPLLKCEAELKENIRAGKLIIKKNIEQLQSTIKINKENLINIQDQYPLILERLHNFYLSFHEILVNKKNQQLAQLSQNWSRLRYTYSLRVKQLDRIKQYLSYQLQKLNLDLKGQGVLYNRNIIGALSRIQGMIKKQIGISEVGRFKQDFQRFEVIKQNVQNELVFVNLFKMDALKKAIDYISTKFSPKSYAKYKKQQNNFKSDQNSIIDKNSNSQMSVNENAKSLKNSNPKNRHSKSDLLSKLQISERQKMKYQKQTKKKYFQFHNNIVMKSQKQLMRKRITQPKSPSKQKISTKK